MHEKDFMGEKADLGDIGAPAPRGRAVPPAGAASFLKPGSSSFANPS